VVDRAAEVARFAGCTCSRNGEDPGAARGALHVVIRDGHADRDCVETT
jgi:hypothetical protein